MIKYWKVVLLASCLNSLILPAQDFDCFEFFNHPKFHNYKNFLPLEDAALLVGNSPEGGFIERVNSLKETTSLWQSSYHIGYAKFIKDKDNEDILFIGNLFDYDVLVPEVYLVKNLDTQIEVDTIKVERTWFNFYNIDTNKNGDYVVLLEDSMGTIKDGTISLIPGNPLRLYRITKDNDNNIFFYGNNDNIYKFDDNLNSELVFEYDKDINEFLFHEDQFYILSDDHIVELDSNFENAKTIINLSTNHKSATDLVIAENQYVVLSKDQLDNTDVFYSYNRNSEAKLLYKEPKTTINYFIISKILGNRFYALSNYRRGILKIQKIESITENKRADLALENLKIEFTSMTTEEVEPGVNKDYFNYDFEFTAINKGNIPVEKFSAQSNVILGNLLDGRVHIHIDSINLNFGESYNYSGSIKVPDEKLSGFAMTIIGANLRADYCYDDNTEVLTELNATENSKQQQLNSYVYPNPADEQFSIQEDKIRKLIIYDLNGRMVFFQNQDSPIKKINIHNLNSGNYIIQLENHKEELFYQRLVKL